MIGKSDSFSCNLTHRFNLRWVLVTNLALAAMLGFAQTALAELTAQVDTTVITTEQSLRLVISSDLTNSNNNSPDFSELGKDFEILGSSSQTNLQTIGQKMTQTRSWEDTSLTIVGETAARWMSIAQCFAGPPEAPPAKGQRHLTAG